MVESYSRRASLCPPFVRKNWTNVAFISFMVAHFLWIQFVAVPSVSTNGDSNNMSILASLQQFRNHPVALSTNRNDENVKNEPRNFTITSNYKSETKIPIFYNLYIGNETDIPRIRDLMSEQLSMRDPTIHTPVYITTIGSEIDDKTLESFVYGSKNEAKADEIVHLRHVESGNELLSLESLWEHCSKEENHETSVVYLHSKGSYSNTIENTRLRFFLTAGALSQDCAVGLARRSARKGMEVSHPRCNVCSTRFSPLPHPHTSGNMWAARCDYIAKLFHPSKFDARMRRFSPPGSTRACIGRGRWAAEHWVHTHPTVEPCDLYTSNRFLFNYEHLPNLSSAKDVRKVLYGEGNTNDGSSMMKLQEAPRFDLKTFSSTGICKDTGVGTLDMRLKEARVLYGYTADGSDREEAGGTGGKKPNQSYNTMPLSWWGWKFWNNGSTLV